MTCKAVGGESHYTFFYCLTGKHGELSDFIFGCWFFDSTFPHNLKKSGLLYGEGLHQSRLKLS